jgi:hypothetical protein
MAIIQPAQLATGSYSLSGSFSGSFQGNGAGLNNIPSSAIVGLSSTQIASGNVTASVSTGTGSFTVTSGSSTFMFVSSSGNVGIGTITPTTALSITGTETSGRTIQIRSSAGKPFVEFFTSVSIGIIGSAVAVTGGSANDYGLGTNGNSTANIIFGTGAGYSERMRIFGSTGNVLINTTTDAGFKLDVNGTSIFRSTLGLTETTAIQLAVLTEGNTRILSTTGGQDMILNAFKTRIEFSFGTYNIRKRMMTIYGDTLTNAGVVIGVDAINVSSSILSVESTTKGFLPPRTNLTSNISTPAQGLMTYVTSSATEGLYYYNSGSAIGWHKVLTNSGSQEISGSLNVNNTLYVSGSRVGIGTTTPSSSLHLYNSANVDVIATIESTNARSPYLLINHPSRRYRVGANISVASAFEIYDENASANRLIIQTNGNIGINTTTDAGFKLDVNGTARFSSDVTVANSLMKIYVTGGAIRFEQLAGAGIPINFMQNGNIYQYVDQATTNIAFRNDYSIVMPTGNTSTINASAKLQIDSTTKGFLPPRMTGAQAELISSPAEGLMVYATSGTGVTITSKGWWGYDGATWVKFN